LRFEGGIYETDKKLEYPEGYDSVRREVFIGTDGDVPLDGVDTRSRRRARGSGRRSRCPGRR